MSDYPQTEKEWFKLAEDNCDALMVIIDKYIGLEVAGKFENSLKCKDASLAVAILEKAWAMAPDDPSIHTIPGWGVLCDLCSDFHDCFYEAAESEKED